MQVYRYQLICCIALSVASITASGNHPAPNLDAGNYRSLVSDSRAFRAGEPLSVIVVESTVAESAAETRSARDGGIGLGATDGTNSIDLGITVSGNDNGLGRTTRKGNAYSRLSVKISRVIQEGIYEISGENSLMINGESQKIALYGIIRASDIDRTNTIVSSKIADARIEIFGMGDVDSSQRKSLIYKVMNWLGLL